MFNKIAKMVVEIIGFAESKNIEALEATEFVSFISDENNFVSSASLELTDEYSVEISFVPGSPTYACVYRSDFGIIAVEEIKAVDEETVLRLLGNACRREEFAAIFANAESAQLEEVAEKPAETKRRRI